MSEDRREQGGDDVRDEPGASRGPAGEGDEMPGPSAPETPDAPDAPDVPEPGTPRGPDAPDTPDVPGPGTTDTPRVPDAPDLPGPGELPEEDPGLPEPFVVPDAPEISDAPYVPEPDIPDLPDIPPMPDIPDMPEFPDGGSGPDAASDRPEFPDGSRHPRGAAGTESPDEADTRASSVEPADPGTPTGGGAPGDAGGGPGDHGTGGAPGPGDEDVLRRMMHDSVSGIEPSAASLQYLQHAVPARRAHRRQALVGAAAAVVLAGVGVPALMQSGLAPGTGSDDRPVNAGSSHQRTPTPDGNTVSGGHESSGPSGSSEGHDGPGEEQGSGDSASPSPPDGSSADGDPEGTLRASAPVCGRDQLGSGTARSGAPDGQGRIYGSFRVVNTSGEPCTVEGAGLVDVAAQGRSDSSRIKVLDHTPGDAASGLPDPSGESAELVLRAGAAYSVEFAWVPENCPTDEPVPKSAPGSGSGSAAGTSSGGDAAGTDGDRGGDSGPGIPETGGSGGEDGGEEAPGEGGGGPGSLRLSHTPDVGNPAAAGTTLADTGSCEGTVYRTGVRAAD